MNCTNGGGCCSHDNSSTANDGHEPEPTTQTRSAGRSAGCCGGAAEHSQLAHSNHPPAERHTEATPGSQTKAAAGDAGRSVCRTVAPASQAR